MSNTTCPFDHEFCQKMQDRFNEWKQFVFNNPNMVNHTSGNMFLDCPIKHIEERKEICERYRKFLVINKNTKEI